jgi:hypothetical protein
MPLPKQRTETIFIRNIRVRFHCSDASSFYFFCLLPREFVMMGILQLLPSPPCIARAGPDITPFDSLTRSMLASLVRFQSIMPFLFARHLQTMLSIHPMQRHKLIRFAVTWFSIYCASPRTCCTTALNHPPRPLLAEPHHDVASPLMIRTQLYSP